MAFGDLNSLALTAGSILCSQAGLSLCPRAVGAPAAPEDLPEGGRSETPALSTAAPHWAELSCGKPTGDQPYFSEFGLTMPRGWAP